MTPPDFDARIAQVEGALAEAQADATAQIAETETEVSKMRSERTRRIVILVILTIFGVVLLFYMGWLVFGSIGEGTYICADQAEEAASLCKSRWTVVTAALLNVAVVLVLPLVTLTLGYYFGKAPASDV